MRLWRLGRGCRIRSVIRRPKFCRFGAWGCRKRWWGYQAYCCPQQTSSHLSCWRHKPKYSNFHQYYQLSCNFPRHISDKPHYQRPTQSSWTHSFSTAAACWSACPKVGSSELFLRNWAGEALALEILVCGWSAWVAASAEAGWDALMLGSRKIIQCFWLRVAQAIARETNFDCTQFIDP